jgi:hypothetical protein
VRAGDHDEFGVLFSEHARAVYNHAFRLTGNWSAAEEVVSLTFLEAWRLRGTVRPEGGSLLPWLLGIALNVARNVSRAARQPAPVVRDSDFTYIRSEVAYEVDSISNGHETTSMEKLHERQIWLPVANVCATGLLIEQGERTPISPFPVVNGKVDRHPPQGTPMPNVTCPSEGHLGDTTYRLLQSIPTQPDALLAYLKAGKKWTNDDPPTEIGDMIRETIMPPALAAALYRLAATLPGATLVPHATNVAGRAGIGIMWTSKTARQVYKNEWIFDQTTLRFIGEKTYDPGTGRLTGESAIIQQAFTARSGQLPR